MSAVIGKGGDHDARPTASRARRIASVLVIVVASFASLATSYSHTELSEEARGAEFTLTPSDPTARASFVFEATGAALDGWDTLALQLDVATVWSGLDLRTTPDVEVNVRKVSGPALGQPFGLGCVADVNCIGTYEVTFRWPEGVQRGSVRVLWAARGSITYQLGSPPAGASISVMADPQVDPARSKEFTSIPVQLDRGWPRQMIRVDVVLESPTSEDFFLEVLGVELHGRGDEALVSTRQHGRWISVPDKEPLPLIVPDRCRSEPCSFQLLVLTELVRPGNDSVANVTWAMTGDEAADAVATIDYVVEPALEEAVALPSFRLDQAPTDPSSIHLHIPARALPRSEFQRTGSIVEAALVMYSDEAVPGGNAHLLVKFTSPKGVRSVFDWGVTSTEVNPAGARVVNPREIPFLIPQRCRLGRACDLEMSVEIVPDHFLARGGVIVTPTIEVSIAFPRMGRAPTGAHLRLVAER